MITEIEHTADAGFECIAESYEEMFRQMAMAMLGMAYAVDKVEPSEERELEIRAEAPDLLLHDFLSELLQVIYYGRFLVAEIEFEHIDFKTLKAKLRGEKFDPSRHEYRNEIKAVTYHMLVAEPRGDKWFGRVIFDL